MNLDGLRPIRGPVTPGFWETNWFWAAPAIAVAVILAVVLAFWVRKRLGRPKIPTAREIYETEAAEIRGLIDRGETAEVPSRLSRVLREYIETSTGLRAPEQTTEEFLAHAGDAGPDPQSEAGAGLPVEAIEELRPFLTLTDEAKFARRNLGPSECTELLRIADRFVAANEDRREAA